MSATITFGELRDEQLPRFGIAYRDRMLRYAFQGLSVRPVGRTVNESTGKGRVMLFDVLTGWVVKSAHVAVTAGSVKDLRQPLDDFRVLARKSFHGGEDSDDARAERIANYMFITSPEYGMAAREIRTLLFRDPGLLDVAPEGQEAFYFLLRAYLNGRALWEASQPLTPREERVDVPPEVDRVRFARSTAQELADVGLTDRDCLDASDWFAGR